MPTRPWRIPTASRTSSRCAAAANFILIELNDLKRSEDNPARREALLKEAREQLRRYAGDQRVREALGEAQLHSRVLLTAAGNWLHREAV